MTSDKIRELFRAITVWRRGDGEGAAHTDAKKSELIEHNVHGRFLPEIYKKLSEDKHLMRAIVQELLDANFPESIHQDILDELGIEFEIGTRMVIVRSPDFRERILRAYEYSCAVCGFDVRLGTIPVALEAAHKMASGRRTGRRAQRTCALHSAP